MTTQTVTSTFKVHVNQVLIRVVVSDAHGNAVGNLRREDFQILDKGKPQVLTAFSVESANPKPEAPGSRPSGEVAEEAANRPVFPERYIAYVFDDLHLEMDDLMHVKRALEGQFQNILRPTDRVAILTTSSHVQLDFTDDRARLSEALARVQPRPLREQESTQCPYMSYYLADQIAGHHDPDALNWAIQEAYACKNGRITASEAQGMALASALENYTIGDAETRAALRVLTECSGRLKATLGLRSIVFVSSGFHMHDQYAELENLIDRASRSGVIIHALDPRGLWIETNFRADRRITPRIGVDYRRDSVHEQDNILGDIADGTGGSWFHNNNDLAEGARRTAQTPEFVYELAFSPQNLKLDGSFHALQVTVKGPSSYRIVARRGYYAPRKLADPVEAAQREVEEALFSQEELHDIPVSVHTQFFRSGEDAASLSVLARVDLGHVPFRRETDRNRDQLTVVTGIFDRNGRFVSGEQKLIDFRLRDQTLHGELRNGVVMKATFTVKPGGYLVRVVVRDAEGQQLSASNGSVEIP